MDIYRVLNKTQSPMTDIWKQRKGAVVAVNFWSPFTTLAEYISLVHFQLESLLSTSVVIRRLGYYVTNECSMRNIYNVFYCNEINEMK